MIKLNKVHHVAIICSNYEESKAFYIDLLGFKIMNEIYRKGRQSYKLELSLNGLYVIELFSFPNPPKRISGPEAVGLRHLAFEVDDFNLTLKVLKRKGVKVEEVRIDNIKNKRFTFIFDPDNLPIELVEK
ncbi:SMU1112c/YaeR family gloxylase I-like metalloprotein [Aquimarina algiphila]|uniref:VOC family protein n=1 Tax=Aquimarina algiphila TaxID=2047982 RepID=A0A554VIU8_9FLAO|nr:VOC family protein [Aquimarina algiphila]TSE07767.1 VOC family protein [Aquimarina algiphila]